MAVDALTLAATSSFGSNIFIITAITAIALIVLLVIRHYVPLRQTPAYLLVPVFLALALPCSIILLVPVDLASIQRNETEYSRGIWLPERAVLVGWRIIYWLTFVLTWFILPFLGEYCDSGYRDPKDRMLYSLRTNARYQLIMLVTGIAGLIYFIWENGLHVSSIKGLVMALAYAWGLMLAIGLMGHGLVALPRGILKNASVSARLRNLQTQAPQIKDNLDEATEKLLEVENTVDQLRKHKGGQTQEQQDWIDELAESCQAPLGARHSVPVATNARIPTVVTDRWLSDLTRKLKRARHRKARFASEWTNLCQRAQDAQTILDAAASKKLDFGRTGTGTSSLFSRLKLLTPSTRFYLHSYAIPWFRIGLSVVLALGSVFIVWSEIVRAFLPGLSVIGLSVVQHHLSPDRAQVNFGGQIIAAAWLLYMDAAALYAISAVKVWNERALVKRQTYSESCIWYSLQTAKLTVPLSFNFITMMSPSVYEETSFYKFLGELIRLTLIGRWFSRFFPLFLLVPFLANLFNLYGKIKTVFGFGVLEDDSEDNPSGFGTGGWREGRALIEREAQLQGDEGVVGLASRGETWSEASAVRDDEGIRQANRHFNHITNHEEQEDDSARHFYQDIGERLRNTFDTTERPEWVRNIGDAFKAPRWTQRDQRDDTGGSVLARWFGGRPEEGRLQL